ncbi:MAG TPA: DUF362 domain-containing protein [Spirochaetota bacterium]|nr:DUF362 domain-containing protein [Spirochaetota bacterium]
MKKRQVIIRRCDEYDPARIAKIIGEGIRELGLEPKGRVLIKPNVVTANTEYIHHSYTEPRMVESMVSVLRSSYGCDTVTVGESGGIGMPTRLFFSDSGFRKMADRINVPLVDFNEEQTVKMALKKAKWHKTMLVAKSLHEAEFKIWMPKLKYHIVTDITNALKLNIGILTHKERFLYHDDRLLEKIVDMLEIGYPDLIVTDAITCGMGFESSPTPFHLGAIIMSNDPVAIDVVAAKILGYEPKKVGHLVEAHDRGYGSIDLKDIKVTGDVSIAELAAKTKDIVSPFQDLQKLDTRVKFYEGINKESGNVCFGGCICSIKGVLGTADKRRPGTLKNAKPGAIVMGYYKGDVIHPGETVALIGTCAGVSGRLEAGRVIHIKGCPVKVKDLMLFLLWRFRISSPAFDAKNMVKLIYHSIIKAFMQLTVPLRKSARLRH